MSPILEFIHQRVEINELEKLLITERGKTRKLNITSCPFPLNFSSLNNLHNSSNPFGPVSL